MRKIVLSLFFFVTVACNAGDIELKQVDVLSRVFPDMELGADQDLPEVHVPRGTAVCFQFAIKSKQNTSVNISLDKEFLKAGFTAKVYEALPVHVEGNSVGCMKTSPYPSKPPADFMPYLIREAPFDVAEALAAKDTIELDKDLYYSIVLEVQTDKNDRPGVYSGRLIAESGDEKVEEPFSFILHQTAVTDYELDCTHWLWTAPQNLTSGEAPQWYSERHWKLIETAGRKLKDYGNNCIFTLTVGARHDYTVDKPLVTTYLEEDGSYEFDFSNFERWCELFFSLGYKTIEGSHLSQGHIVAPLVVKAIEKKSGKEIVLFDSKSDLDEYIEFLDIFFKQQYKVLEDNGWTSRYYQHIMDEPDVEEVEKYSRISELVKKNMPGVKSVEAINVRSDAYYPYVDVCVFYIWNLNVKQELAKELSSKGKDIWMYQCCNPPAPWANRWLDMPLSNNRLYPWAAQLLGADGYLFWAANGYRGADPYTSSIGPIPSGSQNPGHPSGDCWVFYPGPEGLRGSLRMIAFRDGLVDHALLNMLHKKDPQQADKFVKSIIRSLKDYERDQNGFYRMREKLLSELEK